MEKKQEIEVINPNKNKEKYFSRGIPSVKYLSPEKIWLVNERGQKLKRICGHNLKGMPDGYLCQNYAGHGTSHEGVGYCQWHDYKQEGKTWFKQIQGMAKNNNLKRILDESGDLDVKLEDVTEELMLQKAVVSWYFEYINEEQEDGSPKPGDLDRLMNYLESIRRTKESGARIKGSTKLEASVAKSFVQQIFTIFAKWAKKYNHSKEEIAEFLQEVSLNVVDPMTAESLQSGKVVSEENDGEVRLKKKKEIGDITKEEHEGRKNS